MIEISQLCFDYPGTHALKDISCQIPAGSITALVGPNGAGKTTLMRSMCALSIPVSGKILIDGCDASQDPRKIHELCSYLSDFFGLYDNLTVEQCLQYAAWAHNCPTSETNSLVHNIVQELNLTEHRHKKAGSLSRGLRQRLAIGQTIIHKPKYILLDEPASGLDPDARAQLANMLKKLKNDGLTLIVSSHILAELEDYCTHIMILKEGKLVEYAALDDKAKKPLQIIEIVLTENSNAEEYAGKISNINHIQLLGTNENVITVQCDTKQLPANQLLQQCMQAGLPVESFQLKKSNLQDHYLNITQDKKV